MMIGRMCCRALIKAPLPGWRVELDHRKGNSEHSINLGWFLSGSKVTLNDTIKKNKKIKKTL